MIQPYQWQTLRSLYNHFFNLKSFWLENCLWFYSRRFVTVWLQNLWLQVSKSYRQKTSKNLRKNCFKELAPRPCVQSWWDESRQVFRAPTYYHSNSTAILFAKIDFRRGRGLVALMGINSRTEVWGLNFEKLNCFQQTLKDDLKYVKYMTSWNASVKGQFYFMVI